jgi:hypothetical protein
MPQERQRLVRYNYALKTLGERLGLGFHPPSLGTKAGQRILSLGRPITAATVGPSARRPQARSCGSDMSRAVRVPSFIFLACVAMLSDAEQTYATSFCVAHRLAKMCSRETPRLKQSATTVCPRHPLAGLGNIDPADLGAHVPRL